MNQGDTVQLKPEFAEGDSSLYVIVEMRGDRCVIEAIVWPYGPLHPQETVSVDMLQFPQTNCNH